MSVHHVYLITNKNNNKKYIGYTNTTPHKRFLQHQRDAIKTATHKSHFHNAIMKHGATAFMVDELWRGDTAKDGLNAEVYFINAYDTQNASVGYNMTPGGTGGNTQHCWSDTRKSEFIKHMSSVTKGHKRWTTENRSRLSMSIRHTLQQIPENVKIKQYQRIGDANRAFYASMHGTNDELDYRCNFLRKYNSALAKYTNTDILSMCGDIVTESHQGNSLRNIESRFPVSRPTIKKIIDGDHWSDQFMKTVDDPPIR